MALLIILCFSYNTESSILYYINYNCITEHKLFIKYGRFQLLFRWQDVAGARTIYINVPSPADHVRTHTLLFMPVTKQTLYYRHALSTTNGACDIGSWAFCTYYPETIFDRFSANRGWGIDKHAIRIRRHVSAKIKCVCVCVYVWQCDPAYKYSLVSILYIYIYI